MFIGGSLFDVILHSNMSAHLHNINGAPMGNAILRTRITVKTCFPQIHVPYTLLRAIATKYSEI